jgi:hypothetical protein
VELVAFPADVVGALLTAGVVTAPGVVVVASGVVAVGPGLGTVLVISGVVVIVSVGSVVDIVPDMLYPLLV